MTSETSQADAIGFRMRGPWANGRGELLWWEASAKAWKRRCLSLLRHAPVATNPPHAQRLQGNGCCGFLEDGSGPMASLAALPKRTLGQFAPPKPPGRY